MRTSMTARPLLARFGATLLISAAWAYAPAATAADGSAAAATDSTALEEVVITAEKRTESALTTPVALATFDDGTIKENQIITVADLQNIDPSINVSKGGGFGDTITIRGVTSVDGTSKGTPGIAFNVDGIPINRGYEQALGFFDLDRVELLKGPQGTLYGASSTGGALNIITAKPKDQFDASADLTVGDYNTRRTTAMVNLPLAEWVAVRAAVNYNYRDGFETLSDGTPYTNGENNLSSRVSALFKFTSDMDLLLQETNGSVGGPGGGAVNWDTFQDSPTGSAQRVVYADPFPNRVDDTYSNFNAQYNWTLGPVRLSYVGGYLNYSANEHSSNTNNPLEQGGALGTYSWRDYRGHALTDSHELRLANSEPGAFDWVIGGNWFRENIHESDHNWNDPITTAGVDPDPTQSINAIDPLNNTIHTAEGVFGQITWHLTNQWDLTAGARETRDTLNRHGTFALGGGPGAPLSATEPNAWLNQGGTPCIAPEDCVGGPNNGSESDSKFTYRGNVAYHFTATQMVFATIASGFKGGGFNDFCPATGQACPYGPEELTSYELGYKGRPLENFEIDSDLFYYNYSERQFSQLELFFAGPGQVVGVIDTVLAPAVIEGWDNSFVFRPTHNDEVNLSIELLKSHYVSLLTYTPTGSPFNPNYNIGGDSLDNTPSFAGTLSYVHTFPLADGADIKLHLNTKYSASYNQNNIGPYVAYVQPAFTRSNADIRYTNPTGKVYVGAFVTNIENKMQLEGSPGNASTPGITNALSVGVSDPRTWGFTAGVKF